MIKTSYKEFIENLKVDPKKELRRLLIKKFKETPLQCPNCSSDHLRVCYKSNNFRDRVCLNCEHRFSTTEIIIEEIVKNSEM